MIIHIVQPGDTLNSIAEIYGVSMERLVLDNEPLNPAHLVPGQTIVIALPEQSYIVQEGDTLESIASNYQIQVMQLLRNNPYLVNRTTLIPGETLVISYPTTRKVTTHGFAYPYIDNNVLKKTLPYLTYLSVFNYTVAENGELKSSYDDTAIIQTAKEFGTIPLMMTSSLTTRGEPNVETAYNILLNEDYQDRQIDDILNFLQTKGYYGVNITFNYLNLANQQLYVNFISRIYNRISSEGYLVFITVNPNILYSENEVEFDRIDYSTISHTANNLTFLNFIWGTNYGPPLPVSSNYNMRRFFDYVTPLIPGIMLQVGTPIIGYNWSLPYEPGKPAASITLNSALSLAQDVNATIQFDEISQTPYYFFNSFNFGVPQQHIVRFIDARTIDSLMKVVTDYELAGAGIWTIMVYSAQIWLVINSQYEIEKLPLNQ